MEQLLQKIILLVTSLSGVIYPPVLGDSTVTYPYTFPTTPYVCNSYDECCRYCACSVAGSGNGYACDQNFPSCQSQTNLCSSTMSPTPTTTQTTTYTKLVLPSSVTLTPGQSQDFNLYMVMSNGDQFAESDSYITWTLLNGGGTINFQGVFTAGSTTDRFYVRGEAAGSGNTASIDIISQPTSTPQPTNTPIPYTALTPTPTRIPTSTPTPYYTYTSTYPTSTPTIKLTNTPTPYSSSTSTNYNTAVTYTPTPSPTKTST